LITFSPLWAKAMRKREGNLIQNYTKKKLTKKNGKKKELLSGTNQFPTIEFFSNEGGKVKETRNYFECEKKRGGKVETALQIQKEGGNIALGAKKRKQKLYELFIKREGQSFYKAQKKGERFPAPKGGEGRGKLIFTGQKRRSLSINFGKRKGFRHKEREEKKKIIAQKKGGVGGVLHLFHGRGEGRFCEVLVFGGEERPH